MHELGRCASVQLVLKHPLMSRRRHVVAVMELLIMQRVLGYAKGLRVTSAAGIHKGEIEKSFWSSKGIENDKWNWSLNTDLEISCSRVGAWRELERRGAVEVTWQATDVTANKCERLRFYILFVHWGRRLAVLSEWAGTRHQHYSSGVPASFKCVLLFFLFGTMAKLLVTMPAYCRLKCIINTAAGVTS